jgi:hypothetical protein
VAAALVRAHKAQAALALSTQAVVAAADLLLLPIKLAALAALASSLFVTPTLLPTLQALAAG